MPFAKREGETSLTERTTQSSVTFLHDFALQGLDELQPPGTYLIETIEETIDSLSFLAYRRISTTITLPAVGTASLRRRVVTVDPKELAAALSRDAVAGNALK